MFHQNQQKKTMKKNSWKPFQLQAQVFFVKTNLSQVPMHDLKVGSIVHHPWLHLGEHVWPWMILAVLKDGTQ